ncbi:hypothetical protein EMPS_01169 [Entomortierella parvispora]|uniref:Protein YAE1 n=1 Tax=Entomortierella parvispora TaxID=205924 RepID=A0A9P3H2C0_9FUNG|nr:hypothetical protein EMPS_01169 [Entomortierella parvispora]
MTDRDSRTNASPTWSSDKGSDSGNGSGNDDDIWGDDDNVSYDRSIAEREWSRLHENFGNSGYLEGIEEGKESTLQDGFNQGWSEGVQYGHELGRLRGLISPLLEYIQSSSRGASNTSSTDLLRSLDETQQKTWIQTASDLVKELIELDIAKVFDKAYFDDGLGPNSTSKTQQQTTDSGCCGGSSSKSGNESCCKSDNKGDKEESAIPQKSGCCSKPSSASGDGTASSSCSKGSSCGQAKSEESGAASTSAWSSRPDHVLADYRSRTLDLLKQVKLEHLLESN